MFGADVAPTELGCFHLHHYKDFVPTGLGPWPIFNSTAAHSLPWREGRGEGEGSVRTAKRVENLICVAKRQAARPRTTGRRRLLRHHFRHARLRVVVVFHPGGRRRDVGEILRRQLLQILREPSGFGIEERDGPIETRTHDGLAGRLLGPDHCSNVFHGRSQRAAAGGSVGVGLRSGS